MKKLAILLLTIFTIKPAAVTYDFSGGRLGDNLITYCHARWVSYKYDIQLLYRPFKYSEKFSLHFNHAFFEMKDSKEFDKVVNFSKLKGKHHDLNIEKDSNTLYIIPYFPEVKSDIKRHFHFDVDWKEPEFQKILHEEIVPIEPVMKLDLPTDKYCIAVHIRTGGGHDKIFQMRKTTSTSPSSASRSTVADKKFPLKLPPESYYVEQIQRMSELLGDEPMYVHIFTDSSEVAALASYLEKEVNKPNIEFGFRQSGNRFDANILDDMFGLLEFDYLIRPESNFSIIAGKLKVYNITIFPTQFSWDFNKLTIDKVTTLIKDKPQDLTMRSRLKSSLKNLFDYFK